MDITKWTYFQYRKQFDYPAFIRFKEEELDSKFLHLLQELGFSALTEIEAKKIPLQKPNTRILTIQEASSRLMMQINGSDLLDKYGPESLSLQMGMPVYTYRKVGIMGMPLSKSLWDLAISPDLSLTEQMVGLRVILVRFISQALANEGILCYWGTVKNDTLVVMKQADSFGEAILIDVHKRMIFSNDGEMKLGSKLKILRKDKELHQSRHMSREDVIGFMSVSTCLLSFSGITQTMKKAIYDLSISVSASYAVSESTVNL